RRFDLLLNLFSFLLRHPFLHRLRSALNQRLGLGQAKTGDRSSDFLDHSNLIRSNLFQDHVESGFLLDYRCSRRARAAHGSCRDGHWRSRAYTPSLFKLFHQISDFKHCETAKLFNDLICICHFLLLSVSSRSEASKHLRIRSRESRRGTMFIYVPDVRLPSHLELERRRRQEIQITGIPRFHRFPVAGSIKPFLSLAGPPCRSVPSAIAPAMRPAH